MAMNNGNGGGRKNPPIPLALAPQDGDMDGDDEETYIVVGEAGEDVAFEVCEDLEIALDVRETMMEDGFTVRLFQATEVEVVADEDPAPGGGSPSGGGGGFAA